MRFIWVLPLLTLATVAHADPTSFSQGSGETISFHGYEDDKGGFYAAWAGGDLGKPASLMAQHFAADGKPLWGADGIVVSSQIARVEDWSGLADGQGGMTLYWDESDGVHAQRFRPDGSRRRKGNSVRLSTTTAIQPDAVADAAGGTLVVWREAVDSYRGVLVAQRYDPKGKTLWGKGGLRVSLRASDQSNPRVIYDNMSGMIVAWRDLVNGASEMRAQRIDFQGNRLWTAEGLHIMNAMGNQDFAQMAPLGPGEMVVAWTGAPTNINQILLQKIGPEPVTKWPTPTQASLGPVRYAQWNPLLQGDERAGSWVVWEDYRNQQNYQIYLNHLLGNGTSAWPSGEVPVGAFQSDQGKAAMAVDVSTSVWVAWIDNRLATVGIYYQHVDSTGTLHEGLPGRKLVDGLSKPSVPHLVALSPGRAAVLWADRPKKKSWALFWMSVQDPNP